MRLLLANDWFVQLTDISISHIISRYTYLRLGINMKKLFGLIFFIAALSACAANYYGYTKEKMGQFNT